MNRCGRIGLMGLAGALAISSCAEPVRYPRRAGTTERVAMGDPLAVRFVECGEARAEGVLVVRLAIPKVPFDREIALPIRREPAADLGGMYRQPKPDVMRGFIAPAGISEHEPVSGHLIVRSGIAGGLALEVKLDWRNGDGTRGEMVGTIPLDPQARECWELAPGVSLTTKIAPIAPAGGAAGKGEGDRP